MLTLIKIVCAERKTGAVNRLHFRMMISTFVNEGEGSQPKAGGVGGVRSN